MKTLSEFFGKSLRSLEEQLPKIREEAAQTAQAGEEALKTEGKSEEEIKAATAEATQTAINAKLEELTKYQGDKITWLKNALSLIEGKRGNLKRVIVMEAAEGEKSTREARLVDGKYFAVEFYQEAARPAAPEHSRGGRFGDKRGGGKGRGGRDSDRKGRDGKPGRSFGDRPARGPGAGPAQTVTDGAPRTARPQPARRAPTERAPAHVPGTGKTSPLIILNGKSSQAPAAAPAEKPAAHPETSETT
jgi:hypothetical protein